MTLNYDDIRYGRDWRYGSFQAPWEDEGSLSDVWWLAFPTPKHREQYVGDLKLNGDHMDFLSEKEIAFAIGVKSRQELWEYFDFADPRVVADFLRDGWRGIYGKTDPLDRASSG